MRLFSFVGALGMLSLFAMRTCLSVALVEIASERHWSQADRGIVLSSFFFGYLTLEIAGGHWAQRGVKHAYGIFTAGMAVAGICTLAAPFATERFGVWGLAAIRFVAGVGQSVTFPAMHALVEGVATAETRGSVSGIVYSGAFCGVLVSMPVSGALVHGSGWESVFYAHGAFTLGVVALWVACARTLIARSAAAAPEEISDVLIAGDKPPAGPSTARTLRLLASSPAFWALVCGHAAGVFHLTFFITQLPLYLAEGGPGLRSARAGELSAVPYAGLLVLWIAAGVGGDALVARGWRVRRVRQLAQGSGAALTAAFLALALGTGSYWPVFAAAVALGCNSSGYAVNHLDLGRAGFLMGLTNTFSTLAGALAPVATAAVLSSPQAGDDLPARWHVVFVMVAAVYGGLSLVFVAFVSDKNLFTAAAPVVSPE